MFLVKSSNDRLHKSDAAYVDIIHTCAGILGIRGSIGHADFYPNGGFRQSGCCDGTFNTTICLKANFLQFKKLILFFFSNVLAQQSNGLLFGVGDETTRIQGCSM